MKDLDINKPKQATPENDTFIQESFKTIIAVGLFLLLVVAILFPLLTIWSLNVLFGLQIAYTFKTWLAAVILIVTLQAAINIKKEKTVTFKRPDA
jgi:uncharacterized membrane protein